MNPVGSLSQASYTALRGLDRAFRKIEESAFEVGAGPFDQAFGSPFEAFVDLDEARLQVSANLAVLRTVGPLLSDLSRLPRH